MTRARRTGIDYPLLSDVDAATMMAPGILDDSYEPGDSAYGIPFPGIFIADRRGVVQEKIFIRGYDTCMHAENVLAAGERRPQGCPDGHSGINPRYSGKPATVRKRPRRGTNTARPAT